MTRGAANCSPRRRGLDLLHILRQWDLAYQLFGDVASLTKPVLCRSYLKYALVTAAAPLFARAR